MKTCNVCKEYKSLSEFYHFKGKPQYQCKTCFFKYLHARRKVKGTYGHYYSRYLRKKRSAKKYGVEFNLKPAEVILMLKETNCHYCKQEMSQKTFDRIVPVLGYTTGNVVICCRGCNNMKSNFTVEHIPLLSNILKELKRVKKQNNTKQ